ncbi:hypothetical protein Lal_00004872 [Lupinus albus]|nr:hypothetical protein Lal_00004872 [Lupinus albus]
MTHDFMAPKAGKAALVPPVPNATRIGLGFVRKSEGNRLFFYLLSGVVDLTRGAMLQSLSPLVQRISKKHQI